MRVQEEGGPPQDSLKQAAVATATHNALADPARAEAEAARAKSSELRSTMQAASAVLVCQAPTPGAKPWNPIQNPKPKTLLNRRRPPGPQSRRHRRLGVSIWAHIGASCFLASIWKSAW